MGNGNKKPTKTVASTKHTGTKPPHTPSMSMIQNFLIVWLDANMDPLNDDYRNIITKLGEISSTVNTFSKVDECISFISDVNDKKVFIIISGALGEKTVPVVHNMAQISAIYIFCGDKIRHQQWARQYLKIKGVFTDIKPICEELGKAILECDESTMSMSLTAIKDDRVKENLDQLDSSFMYTQILKEIILTIDFEQEHFMVFITYCRQQFNDNSTELKNVDKLEKEYRQHTAIWWYTYDCFLYSMVNCALGTIKIDLIIELGFFIRDLHEHITRLHSEQYARQHHSNSFVVYYGQSLSRTAFDQLVKTQGRLLSFNHFLLTNKNRQVTLDFARQTVASSDMVGILFVMSIDPSIRTIPFADVHDVSYHEKEEEILFSMHSVFRMEQIQQIDGNDRLWQVDLTLTTDNDRDLHMLSEQVREETFTHENGWYRLGNLLMKLGQVNKAQQVYENMLTQTINDHEKANIYHQLGWINYNQGEYVEALAYFEKALEIKQKSLPPNHPDLATSYNNIGGVYDNMGEYSRALSYYEKVLEIRQITLPTNHPDLATSYNNIGTVYDNMDEYPKAFSYYEKALEIKQKTLPPNHPDLATSYNNIGSMYEKMDEYPKALASHEKAFEIYQKSLPPNHPSLATSYASLASVYFKMGDHSKALSFYERALDIGKYSLPPNHPKLQLYKKNIEEIKKKL